MIAPVATLVFLATLWLLVVVGAAVLEESGARIAAALKGKPAVQPKLQLPRQRVRVRSGSRSVMPAAPRWRVAA